MALVLEQIHTPGIAQLSYLIGDDDAKIGAVVDPRRDVEVYLEMARRRGLRIAYAIETHIHADFVSGVHELVARTGCRIVAGHSSDYTFDLQPLADGEALELGSVRLKGLHTPGHTPEHLSLTVSAEDQGDSPFAVLTGDTLLNLSVGRPDLVGEDVEERLARQLYRSVFEKLLPLGDWVLALTGHTAGSACARSIGHRSSSTLGSERLVNPSLAVRGEQEFVDKLLGGLAEPPRHYARLKKVNAGGAPVLGTIADLQPLDAAEMARRTRDSHSLLLDIRSMLAFGGGHIPGALHIGLGDNFPTWVGWMVDPTTTILLVGEGVDHVSEAAEHLFRLGYDRIGGFLHPGMKSWQNAGLPLQRGLEWTVHELEERRTDPDVTVLDVRSDPEWEEGHVPGAEHIFLPHLEERLGELDRGRLVAAYCGTGYRASIAASVLQRHGFERVATVPGSMTAWRAHDLPLTRGE